MHKVKAVFNIVFVLSTFWLNAQQPTTGLEPKKILIGEQAVFSFSITIPIGSRLHLPVFNENLNEKIEIIEYGLTDSVPSTDDAKSTTFSRSMIVTSWEEGLHVIEPIDLLVITGQDTTIVKTEPLLLEVEPYEIDEESDLKDIKPIRKAPVTLAEIKYYILGAILLAVLIWLLIRYLKKRKKAPVIESIWEKPDIPAHVAAINSLEQLKAMKLWQQGKVKEYYVTLNDIERHYIEKRFHVGAMEMTSSEIMEIMKPHIDGKDLRDILHSMLYLSDMVKFAKYAPTPTENEMSMDMAFEFVSRTKPVITEDSKDLPASDNHNE
jgi:hypothetical protein